MVTGPKRAQPTGARLALLLVLAGGAILGGCGPDPQAHLPDARRLVAATQVPVLGCLWDVGDVAVPGSRLVVLDLERPGGAVVLLSEGFLGASHARPTLDGERVLFTALTAEDAPTSIWSCRLDGTDRRRVVDHEGDCQTPDELPDGRIVFAARTAGPGSPRALWVTLPGGGRASRITFDGGDAFDPCVLPDGRVLHAYAPVPGVPAVLRTVHPDGTGVARLPGVHRGVRRPRPSADGRRVWVLVCDDQGLHHGYAYFTAQPGSTGPVERSRAWLDQAFSGSWAALEPTRDGRLLACPGPSWNLPGFHLVGPPAPAVGDEVSLGTPHASGAGPYLADPAWAVMHAVEIAPRPRPQGHLSMVRPGAGTGALLAIDARVGVVGGGLRVRGADALFSPTVPLAPDGSFHVRVPPDEKLALDVIDADGAVAGTCDGGLWVRPGETRVCVGCHHDRTRAPHNVRPQAVLGEPVTVGPKRGGR